MDFDSVPFDLPGPVSHRAADLLPAYEALTRRGLHIMDEQIFGEDAYSSNRNGHFAWDISLLIRASCLLWKVTHDPAVLVRASNWAVHMLQRTDEAMGREDWRGKRSPLWSAGERYTARTVEVGSLSGMPISIQAVSERIFIDRPTEHTAIIRSVRSDGDVWTSGEGSLIPGGRDYLPNVLARQSSIHAVLFRGLPTAVDLSFLEPGERSLNPQFGAHLVHTGMIARSLIELAQNLEMVGPGHDEIDVSPDELFEAALRAVLTHDAEIRVRRGQHWYVTPEEFPGRRLGMDLPHNHVVDMASSLLLLGQRYQDDGLTVVGASLTRPWLNELDMLRAREISHPWFYYPLDSDTYSGIERDRPCAETSVSAVKRGEDSSHASVRARAIADWHRIKPTIVGEQYLSDVALAFRRNYMTKKDGVSTIRWLPGAPDDEPGEKRLGQSDTYAGAWCNLYKWDSPLKRHMNKFAYHHPPAEVFGATVLSAAEVAAMNADVT